jgi:hypothetical protein
MDDRPKGQLLLVTQSQSRVHLQGTDHAAALMQMHEKAVRAEVS